jgi:hypothetical protein
LRVIWYCILVMSENWGFHLGLTSLQITSNSRRPCETEISSYFCSSHKNAVLPRMSDEAAILLTCIRKVSSLNLHRDTEYPVWNVRGPLQFLPSDVRVLLHISPPSPPSTFFPSHYAQSFIWYCIIWITDFFFQWLFLPVQAPGLLFSTVIIFRRRYYPLGEWSAHRKVAT